MFAIDKDGAEVGAWAEVPRLAPRASRAARLAGGLVVAPEPDAAVEGEEEIGTLRPSKRAALLAVATDPTRGITRPRPVRLDMAGGRGHRRTPNDGR
jgi:hypothetical protein